MPLFKNQEKNGKFKLSGFKGYAPSRVIIKPTLHVLARQWLEIPTVWRKEGKSGI